jgi:hypothetical protein
MFITRWLFKRRKKDPAAIIKSYSTVFDTPEGKKVLADLCSNGFIDTPSIDVNNPYQTAYNEGRRSMALHILNALQITNESLQRMYNKNEGTYDNG